jgi:arylformamidase
VGTHADAPFHFLPGSPGIGDCDLDPYVGPCWVLDGPRQGQILPEHFADVDLARHPRLLVRTRAEDRIDFEEDFVSLSVDAARELRERGARLIGLDTPSMDPFESQEMLAHHALLEGGIALLENLLLAEVKPGPYELIALPLRWPGLDASPVRAVLRAPAED